MASSVLVGAFLALAVQQPSTSSTSPQSPAALCGQALSSPTVFAVELCAGEDAARAADAAPSGSADRARLADIAAAHYRRAATRAADTEARLLALRALARAYDKAHLNRPPDHEQVLREIIGLAPDDPAPLFELSALQEEQGLIEAAEATLLDARHRNVESLEPNRRLAQFYSRRVTALHTREQQAAPRKAEAPGDPDDNGVYRVGGAIEPPRRSDVPQYPPQARAAGIEGVVVTEIVVDPTGHVTDARVVRSIPLLDDAALEAVRKWQFTPTIVNGQAVPVRMNISVNFRP